MTLNDESSTHRKNVNSVARDRIWQLDNHLRQLHTDLYARIHSKDLSRQFFTTNSVSCQEWLSRTYPFAMIVAYHNGYYAQVIRFGTSALADLEKKQLKAESGLAEGEAPPPVSGQSMAILCWMARAMAELGVEQAVHGLSAWTRRVYHTEMPFLAAIAEIAAARYERSLVLLRQCIEDETLSETFRGMLRDILSSEFSLWNEAEKLEGQTPTGMDAETFARLKQLSMFGKVEAAEPSPGVLWNVWMQAIPGCVLRKMGRKGQLDSEVNAAVLSDLAASFLVENGETYDAGSSPAHLHLPLAKLARKTGNPMLAGVHLHKASNNPVLINNSPVLNSLKVLPVQGTKRCGRLPRRNNVPEVFVTVFATLQGGYEMMCHSYQVLAANVNM
ncbi:hypothetical protein OSTOST_04289, partial [Ostertagia ostertagi]